MNDENVVYDETGLTSVIRRDAKLLACAQAVFGDIVNDAWISTYYGQGRELADAAVRIEHDAAILHKDRMLEPEKGLLGYDSCEIILQFCNGQQVKFTNSEWAHMARVDVSTMLVLP